MVNSRQQYDLNIEKKFPVFQTGTFNSCYYFTVVMYGKNLWAQKNK